MFLIFYHLSSLSIFFPESTLTHFPVAAVPALTDLHDVTIALNGVDLLGTAQFPSFYRGPKKEKPTSSEWQIKLDFK